MWRQLARSRPDVLLREQTSQHAISYEPAPSPPPPRAPRAPHSSTAAAICAAQRTARVASAHPYSDVSSRHKTKLSTRLLAADAYDGVALVLMGGTALAAGLKA